MDKCNFKQMCSLKVNNKPQNVEVVTYFFLQLSIYIACHVQGRIGRWVGALGALVVASFAAL